MHGGYVRADPGRDPLTHPFHMLSPMIRLTLREHRAAASGREIPVRNES
jgi:hypothetical protein